MRISFSPQRREGSLSIIKSGDILTINNESFDFSSIPDGATIVADDIPSEWIIGSVDRIAGELHFTLILPHGPNPSQVVAFPEPITVTEDGPVVIPQGD